MPCGFAECERNDLDVDLSWFCTGIRRIPGARRRTHVDDPAAHAHDDEARSPQGRDHRRRRRRRRDRARRRGRAKRPRSRPRRGADHAVRTPTPPPPPRRSRDPAARARAPRGDARAQAVHVRSLDQRVPARARGRLRSARPRDGHVDLPDHAEHPADPARAARRRALRHDEGALSRARARDEPHGGGGRGARRRRHRRRCASS